MANLYPNSTNYFHSYEPNTNDLTMAMEYDAHGQPVLRTSMSHSQLPIVSTTAWGEPYAIPITPVIQFDAAYGLIPLTDQYVIELNEQGDGTVTAENGTLTMTSGSSSTGTGGFNTVRHIPYRTGQGCLGRFTASFTQGVANSQQRAGLSNGENSYLFGYVGETFGIIHSYNGEVEIRTLTLSAAPTGSETATITLSGTAYTVNLTAGTETFAAATIARAKDTFEPVWRVDQIDKTVVFTSRTSRPYTGTFSFSSATAAGTFAQTNAGQAPTQDVIAQADWDYTPPNFDPTNYNVYQIQMKWLGAGAVYFSCEDPDTGQLVLLHTKKWISTGNQFPHLRKPNLKFGFAAANTSAIASPMIVKMSSAMGSVEGVIQQNNYSISTISTDSSNRAAGNVWHTLTIRNPWTKFDSANTHELIAQRVGFSFQGNDPLIVYVFINARVSNTLQFQPVNTLQLLKSVTLGGTIDTATYQPVIAFNVPINGNNYIDLTPFRLIISPGQEMNVGFLSGQAVSKSNTTVTFAINT